MNNQMLRYPINLEQGKVCLFFSFGNDYVRKYTWESRRHCNPEYELHVILKGTGTVDVEGQQYEIQEKQAILIAPGIYHRPNVDGKGFERFSLGFTFSEGYFSEMMEEKVQQCLFFSPSKEFLDYCDLFIQENIYFYPSKDHALKALASLLTIYLLRDLQLLKNNKADNKLLNEKERTAVIDDFFENDFAQKNGCAKLAGQLHLSMRQLNRYLKDHYGMGFQEKLIHRRMERAAELLRSTNKSVQDIMEAIGYNSITAFYKAFNRSFGMTPQRYRKQKES